MYNSNGAIDYDDKPLADDVDNYSRLEIVYGQGGDFSRLGSTAVPIIDGQVKTVLSSIAAAADLSSVTFRTRDVAASGRVLSIGKMSHQTVYRGSFDSYNISALPVHMVIGYR